MKALRLKWATLDLRQTFADESFMRGHLRAAGLVIRFNDEPATVSRLRSRLRKAGVTGTEARESLGTDLAGYLEMNPKLPLWAAVALVLEATGRFTPVHGEATA